MDERRTASLPECPWRSFAAEIVAVMCVGLAGGVSSAGDDEVVTEVRGGDTITVTKSGVRHAQTFGQYDTVSGYVGYDSYQSYLTVRDKATQEVLLEVKPGDFPAAKVPYARAIWAIEGKYCVYGAAQDGQGAVKVFDLSERKQACEIPADALGPGELYGLQFLGGRLLLTGDVKLKTGWAQLRQVADGKVLWKLDQKDMPGWASQAILFGQRVVMCGGRAEEGGWIEARRFDTGQKLWSAPCDPNGYAPSLTAAGEDRAIVLTRRPSVEQRTVVTCLDIENGKVRWSATVTPMLDEVVVEKDLVVARTERRAVAIDLSSGRIISDTVFEGKGASGAPTSRPSGALTDAFTPQERKEMEALSGASSDEAAQAMGAMSWTMCHCSTEAGRARAQKMFDAMDAYQNDDIVGFRAAGGAKGILDTLNRMLDDPDPVMRAFAAISLAAAGQQGAKEKIAKLMKSPSSRPAEWDEINAEVFGDIDRGRAAMALGILGAKEYADDMAAMLASGNANIRGGAALGLGYLRASRHAKAVAKLLADKEDSVKVCAIDALAMMGARTFAEDIAERVDSRGDRVGEAACFALAKLGAVEQAPVIAALLGKESQRGFAARALAVMGARQYAKDIARLLELTSSLDRKDACLALGLLNAKEQEGAIAKRLKDSEDFVRAAAAFALVLMNSARYSSEVVPIFEKDGCFALSDMRLSKDRREQVQAAARANFKAMKGAASTRPGPARAISR